LLWRHEPCGGRDVLTGPGGQRKECVGQSAENVKEMWSKTLDLCHEDYYSMWHFYDKTRAGNMKTRWTAATAPIPRRRNYRPPMSAH